MHLKGETSKSGRKQEQEFMFGTFLASPPPGEEVVISGMSGQFPDSYDIYHYRDNLYNKVDMISSDNRRWEDIFPEVPHRSGKIFNVDKFDIGFFGIPYRQGISTDPMVRLFLERSVEAVIDAGLNPSELEGTKTGIYVGSCFSEGEKSWSHGFGSITGHTRSIIANRVSFYFKVKGPSVITDNACSSSLYALEHAFKDIRTGRVDMAIVGGSHLTLYPMFTLQFAKLGVLNKDGRCKVFDEKADGYTRSEAIVCIFLQRAKDARRIYGQIIHAKTNSDGYKSEGITYPSKEAQTKLLQEFYYECQIQPTSLSFLEAHGTGTQVGDPEELEAIEKVFCKGRTTPLLAGSVKSNIGHTEPSSGLCSVVKVILGYENEMIAPNLHYQTPRESSKILKDGRLQVVTEKTPFQNEGRLIGINSFGFGGSNAHILLHWNPNSKRNKGLPEDNLPRLVCVSGRVANGTDALLNDLSNRILDKEFIKLHHRIFSKNISGHNYRSYIILSKSGELKRSDPQICENKKTLVLVFTSFDKLWQKIANVFRSLPLFIKSVQRFHDILSVEGINITDLVLNGKPSNKGSEFDEIIGSSVLQIAIVDILKTLEISWDISFGAGVGEYICKYLNGTSTLKETVFSIYNKGLKFKDLKVPDLPTIKSEYIMLEVGNQRLDIYAKRYHNLSFGQVQAGLVSFYEIFGKLYLWGHNCYIDRLYPEIKFPVSRGTPMLSPLLKWDHHRELFTRFFEQKDIIETRQRSINITLASERWTFVVGHVIDGRDLFPASGYIFLVWETLSRIHEYYFLTHMDVVIENIKFLRATTISKTSTVELFVMIQKGSGYFEITEFDSIIANGFIREFKNDRCKQIDLPLPLEEKSEKALLMSTKDVYKELRLRGYNYKGPFRSIVTCDVGVNKALVKWDSNWVAFIDNMLQLKILQMDSRSLFVPTEIKRITIAGRKHMAYVESFGENPNIPVYIYKDVDLIKCGGIEIQGLIANGITVRKPRGEPVLEKYMFVPNETELSIKDSARVIMQLILENLPGFNVKVTEVIDEVISEDSVILSCIIHDVLSDLPLIRPSITLLTKQEIKIPNVTVEDKKLLMETDRTLVIASNLCTSLMSLNQAFNAVQENGFVLSREALNSEISKVILADFDVLTVHTVDDEKFYLLRKSVPLKQSTIIDITGSNEKFHWLDSLQKAIKEDTNVVVVAQNEPLSGILGLVNCIRREPSSSDVKAVFTFGDSPPFDISHPFYSDQLKKNLAINIYKNSKWGTYRHLLLTDEENVECDSNYFGNFLVRGDLSSFKWLKSPLTHDTILPPERELVYVYYSALNFRDIMTASGKISVDTFQERTSIEYVHGFEYSGKTKSGKRVMGITTGALATVVNSDVHLRWDCPDAWSLEEAATIPVVYSTVYCAFFFGCDIRKGKSILIHAGSGGVGQAAIGVALFYGLTVYTTVGTKEKRDFLIKKFPQLKDNHIGNSRNTSFEQMILKETEGRGVDFVLNSLTGEKLLASVRCLADGGHFMEIGKFDLISDSFLSLKLLEKNASFHGMMVDTMFKLEPYRRRLLQRKIEDGIQNGAIQPLVRTVFKPNEVEKAFRFMAAGKHIGKVLIQTREEKNRERAIPKPIILKGAPRYSCNPDHTQIIIGGLGGFGLELADWLVVRGARNLILTSRTGIKTGYQSYRIKLWQSYGVHIYISTANVTTQEGCKELIEQAKSAGPVESIFNLAVVLKDAIFENQTVENFMQSFEPKAFATKHLDEITRILCPNLRDFVIFSSISCGRGNAGQTNYGMANSIMERICEKRKEDGLPALAIEWGAIGDVGLVADLQEEHIELEISGTLQQRISNCIQVLDCLLVQKNAIVSSMVVAEKRAFTGSDNIVEAVAQILGLNDVKTVSPHASLPELGMDSMTAVEIKQTLEREYSVFLTPTDMRNMTFARLTEMQEARKNETEAVKEDQALGGFEMLVRTISIEQNANVPIVSLKSRIEEESPAPKIIIIPGIEGIAKNMAPFTGNINGHVECLQFLNENQFHTIQEMAEDLVPIIENNISITEPFNIVGYSFGVTLALEIVSLLEAKGYSGNLFAIDGAPAVTKKVYNNYIHVESEAVFQTTVLTHIISLFTPAEIITKSKERFLSCNTLEERLNVAEDIIPKNTKHSQFLRAATVASFRRLTAAIDYKVTFPKLKSKVTLFKPFSNSMKDLREDYMLGEMCEKPVEVKVFKGNHVTLLENVEMAEAINAAISGNKTEA